MLRSLAFALLVAGLAACSAHPRAGTTPREQLAFGVSMAQRDLWSEALFRFEQARRLEPSNARVINNLAVAYEAVGRFDDALAAYREALKLAPSDKELKRNYTRFAEFYQGFHAKIPAPAPTPPATGGKP